MKTMCSILIAIVITAVSCCTPTTTTKNYQVIGASVIEANNLLMVEYPDGVPVGLTGAQYKNLLRDKNPTFYPALEPYRVEIKPVGKSFIVKVYDGTALILIDASCTEGKPDCWVYMNQCDPNTFDVPCLH